MGRLRARGRGFVLLPVALALSLIASVAYLASRDSGTNVAMVGDRADAEKARYAAEAGLQHANLLLQQTGCAGTYPRPGPTALVNDSFGGARYVASADRNSGSPVLLSSTGSFNGASVTLTRANVVVYQPTVQSYTVQPDTFTGKDTHVSAVNPTTNYGSSTSLRLASGAFEPMLRFGLGILPPGTRPVTTFDPMSGQLVPGAQMSLYQTQLASGPWSVDVRLVNRSWAAGRQPPGAVPGATWNTSDGVTAWPLPGQGYHPVSLATLPNSGALGWQNWDLTDAAAAWLSGAIPNEGVWLVGAGGSISDARYTSSDEPSAQMQRPKLALKYLLPCGATAPIRATLAPARDAEIDKDRPNHDLSSKTTMSITREEAIDKEPKRVLAYFDVSALGPGTTVAGAALRLFVSSVNPLLTTMPMNLQVHAMVTQTWTEQASWNERTKDSGSGDKNWQPSKGGTFRPTETATTIVPAGFVGGQWIEFDIRSLVQEWVDGVTPNLGLIVLSTTLVKDELFVNSREALSEQPQLVVTYR